ncbi:MAG: penicillin-binding protein 2 [Candidatus Magasanikbacteria bacterium]
MSDGLFEIQSDNHDWQKLDGKFKHNWVEENLHLENPSSKHTTTIGTRKYLGKSILNKRLILFIIILSLGLVTILSRSFYAQILRGDYYRDLAESNRIRIRPIVAERGIIFDRFGKQLVQNIPNFSLSIVPQDLPADKTKRQEVLVKLASISGLTEDYIQNLLLKYKNYSYESLILKDNLDYETSLKIYIESSKMPGVLIEGGTKRNYTFSNNQNFASSTMSLAHVLGYLGKLNDQELEENHSSGYLVSDNIGKTGIEKKYETELRGIYGRKKIEVNSTGSEQAVVAQESPTPGKNLWLTIDLGAQNKLEQLIKNFVAIKGEHRISAIAMDPRNGEILALVSWPSFDNNLFSNGIKQGDYQKYINDPNKPLFNRAIGGNIPSGSIVKPVIAAAALEEKIIDANKTFLSNGGLQVSKWYFKDWKAGGHGITNVTKALAWSINTFFYYIGGGYGNFTGLGVDKILEYMYKFNLAQKTGIDLPGESAGFLPSKEWKKTTKGEQWYVGDTYNLSIGQGDLLVTPLQAAVWTSAFANGGTIVKPHVAMQISSKDSDIEKLSFSPNKTNVVSSKTIDIVRQGMRECVLTGSCQLLKTLSFSSAGKTGTAQWNSTKPEHAWFTAFAPYENPQIVITVLIEEGGQGSTVSMPIARDFLNWWGKQYLTH